MNEDKVSITIKTSLKTILDHFTEEDRSVRERQIRTWRKLKMYWDGFTRIWYSETAHNYRIYEDHSEDGHYDKPINVFKAYLESIIAALSISIPSIRCAPDDADNPLDISTAKAGNKIAELIAKHNNATFLWLHALFIYMTEGMIACYSYSKESEDYGTYETKNYETEEKLQYICPNCASIIPDDVFNIPEIEPEIPLDLSAMGGMESGIEESLPGGLGIEQPLQNPMIPEMGIDGMGGDLSGILPPQMEEEQDNIHCPTCDIVLDPNQEKVKQLETKIVGVTKNPKTRQCMEAYGGLYVKIPVYAIKQSEMPYLIFSYETHYSNAIERYPELKEKFSGKSNIGPGGSSDLYERWGRLSTQYGGDTPDNNVTVRNAWFRPSAYHILDETNSKELKNKFPTGCKVIFVDDIFAAVEEENLDDHWTLTQNPLSDYLHHDPLGTLLTGIQDITNDLTSLTMQTIEQGIPQTFADPAILDFVAYKNQEATPGAVYPTKTVSATKNIADGFFSLKTATLSEEVLPFSDKVQQMGQLVSGALPSLFGGAAEGSKTASEYAMSRAQALQRLQTPWKMLSIWWKEIFGKVIPQYIKDMADDERIVEKDKQGNYINVFIRKAEVQGKIGDIELESAENLPVTWAQQKDVILKIFEMGNPELIGALMDTENLEFVTEALGLTQFKIPGEDDRQKQYEELQILFASEPITQPADPMMIEQAMLNGMPPPEEIQLPSVEIDDLLDNHELEADICRRVLVSEAGRQAKIDNPLGYLNALLHMKAHMSVLAERAIIEQENAQEEQQQQNMQNAPSAKGKDGGKMPTAQIAEKTGEGNAIRQSVQ